MPLLKCSASKARSNSGIRYITDPNKAAIVSVKNLFEDEDYAGKVSFIYIKNIKLRSRTKMIRKIK